MLDLPDGWDYTPHGASEPVQAYAPLVGGPDDGGEVFIGTFEELANVVTRHTRQCVHHYGLARRGALWIYVHAQAIKRRNLG